MAVGSIGALRKTIKTKQRHTAYSKPKERPVSFCTLHYLLLSSYVIVTLNSKELIPQRTFWCQLYHNIPKFPMFSFNTLLQTKCSWLIFNFTYIKTNPAKKPVMQPHTTAAHTVWKFRHLCSYARVMCISGRPTVGCTCTCTHRICLGTVRYYILSCYNIDPFGLETSRGKKH